MSILTVPSPRVTNPNICRRRAWHDYSRPAVYLVTLIRREEVMRFSEFREDISPSNPPVLDLLPNGMIINSVVGNLNSQFKGVSVLAKAIVPDYVTLAIRNNSDDKISLEDIVFWLKKECNDRYLGGEDEWGAEDAVEYISSLFAGGFDERIARRKSDVERFVSHVRNGIREFLYLRRNPEFSHRFYFKTADGRQFEGLGNALLLNDPQISAVKISSKYSETELTSRKQDWFRTVLNGGVLVSPFVSGSENRVKQWALDNGGRVIYLLHNGFGQLYRPHPTLIPALSSGRLLLIAPREENPNLTRPDRTLCVKMNETAEAIASHTLI